MTIANDMNIIIGQGTAIKEVHNVKKQNLEFNQQFIAQETKVKKKERKSKVQESEANSRVEIREDEDEKEKSGREDKKRSISKEIKNKADEINLLEKYIIDIKV